MDDCVVGQGRGVRHSPNDDRDGRRDRHHGPKPSVGRTEQPGGAPSPLTTRVVVDRVIDGDTIDVMQDGQVVRVRLLNIDTPETVDPTTPEECGGQAASDWLHTRLPAGTAVQLSYDVERTDRYGRVLAWVTSTSGQALSTEIAERGLGVAIAVGANTAHVGEVAAAQERAKTQGVGLYDATEPCTVAGQVATTMTALETVTGQQAHGVELARAILAIDAARRSARLLTSALTTPATTVAWQAVSLVDLSSLRNSLNNADRSALERRTELVAEKTTYDAAQQAAEAAKKALVTQKAAAKKGAAEQAERRRAALRSASTPAVHHRSSKPPRSPSGSGDSPSGSGDGSSSTYTGPRCYAPGGKTWRPC